jgi:tetratricopeptide (TPR) repeat protein
MTVSYTSEEVARILNLSDSELRICLKAALFPAPSKRRPESFTFQDLLLLKMARGLCASKIPVARIRRILSLLKRQLPADQMLCNLNIQADGRRIVVTDGSGRWQPDSGQFVFNFEAGDRTTQAIRLRPSRSTLGDRTASDWMALGLDLQEASPDEARAAYRQAIALDPHFGPAHINLGYLHQEQAEWHQAETCYRAAIACGPDEVLGYLYLAALMEGRGERPAAIDAYQKVVELQPNSAEAHYHLAKLYEAEDLRPEAIRHFAAAKRLLDRQRNRPRPHHAPPRPRPTRPTSG